MDKYLIALICNLGQFMFLWWWYVFTPRNDPYLTNIAVVGIVSLGVVLFLSLNWDRICK